MSNLAPIYAPWDGNAEAMAAAIGENPITVRQWRNRGSIPPKYWRKIIASATEMGATLSFEEFIPADDAAEQVLA
ncbi:carph-isopro domain-containing protein [Sphingomonas aerolata]|uniref:carph-isopro domain-containing protein n=1 Tax=Sphingomonas aerolata TaxID=185951 RepID=UPI003A5C3E3C